MPYWDVPNDTESAMLREMGKEPVEHSVHRCGKDFLTFLHYKSHTEFTVRVEEERVNDGRKRNEETVSV